jgi:hypothetical protein
MGMRKEIKKAAKAEMRLIEKRFQENPLDGSAMARWRELDWLLQSYRNTK